jgi:4-diphosphocytidyl-2-C-methyl-D-erythritol kinase
MPDPASVTVRAPAKVNLGLGVGPLRADGFHGLATVYQAVGVYDEVTVARSLETTLTVSGEGVDVRDVPTGPANLALRAVDALAEHHGMPEADSAVTMHVVKRIPVAGGMAGGSADAAAALVATDRLWGLGTRAAALARVAADLGSDVPFCLVGGTATGHGRGEVVSPVTDRSSCWWVVALPGGGLSTPAVYRELDRLRTDRTVGEPEVAKGLLTALDRGSVEALAAAVSNDLEPAALSLRPELAEVLELGRSAGALAALVSGSGPTCLFLAGDADHAQRLAGRLRGDGVVCLLAPGPVPGAQVLSPL